MCNRLHPESTPIPKTGIGYKIFVAFEEEDYEMVSLIKLQTYQKDQNGLITFNAYEFEGEGFCFFLDKQHAESIFNVWLQGRRFNKDRYFLKEIEYFDGLGKHYEPNFIMGQVAEVALCKSFRIKETPNEN